MINRKKTLLMFCALLLIIFSAFAFSAETSRIFILKFNYNNGKITLIEKETAFGYAPDKKYLDDGYKIELSGKEKALYTTKITLPITEYIEFQNTTSKKLEGDLIKYENINFTVAVPYYDDADTIKLFNEKGFEIIKEKLSEEKQNNWGFMLLLALGVIISIIGVIKRTRKKNLK